MQLAAVAHTGTSDGDSDGDSDKHFIVDQGYSTSLTSGPKRKTTGGSWAAHTKLIMSINLIK